MKNINTPLTQLKTWYLTHPKVIVALSGGVDSCLVAYLSRTYLGKENALAVINNSASLKQRDLVDARIFSEKYDIKLVEINADEISDINYSSNPINRCYYCKTNLYQSIQQLVKTTYVDFEILNGNNFSDFGDYRPGIQAANEHNIFSPLADCKIMKDTIREISRYFNLSIWNKPASPCISSRFPYGEEITINKLKLVEKAENYLNDQGFNEVRVRYMNGNAKIEVPNGEISHLKESKELVVTKIKEFGFNNVSIDDEGFISGKLNRNINQNI